MDDLRWLPLVISAIALLVGILSLTISYASYRASGHRVKMVNHRLTIDDEGEWVEVRFANAGRSEVDLEAAWTNWYGSTLTNLPTRLSGGSSLRLTFGGVSGRQPSIGPLSVSVELGNGASFTRRVVLTEEEQGKLVSKRRASRIGVLPIRTEDPIRIDWDEVQKIEGAIIPMATAAEARRRDESGLVFPFYLSLDVSYSMSSLLPDITDQLNSTIREFQSDPLLCDTVWFALITFSNDAELTLPLTPIADVVSIPQLSARGGTFYEPAFRLLRGEIQRDIAARKLEGRRIARAMVIFVTDGMPQDPESLVHPWDTLGRLEPNVIALSLSDTVDPAVLNATVSRRGRAFVARNDNLGWNPAGAIMDTLRSSVMSVTSSIVSGSESVNFQQPLTIARPPGSDVTDDDANDDIQASITQSL